MSNYSKMLRDPRWQRKRLEIMKRSEFMCDECGNEEQELHIHHKYYSSKLRLWQYPDIAYACLCSQCHKDFTELQLEAQEAIAHFPLDVWDIIKCDFLPYLKKVGPLVVHQQLLQTGKQ